MEQTEPGNSHTVLLENREKLSLTGVRDVPGFDDVTVVAVTDHGRLEIRGEDLKITALDLDAGSLSVTGKVASLTYSAAPKSTGGFLSKVFG